MRPHLFVVVLGLMALITGCVEHAPQPTPPNITQGSKDAQRLPGPQPDGSVLLPNQWSLQPAGRQIPLRDFPVNIALHPGGRFVAVLHSGYSQNVVSIIDLTTEKVVAHANVRQSFYGLEF